MPEYMVPIVRRDLLGLWHEMWDSDKPTKRALEANRDGSLGQTFTVKAKSKAEAATLAEAQNPGYVAIRDGVQKLD